MQKIVVYISLITASIAEAAIFITTTTYYQLAVAAILYIPLVYLTFRIFPRRSNVSEIPIKPIKQEDILHQYSSDSITNEGVDISDINKRAFLKIIGATGLSFFLSSLFTRRAESLLLGRVSEPESTSIQDTSGLIINPAQHQPTDNYKISEVDYGIITYYGFIDRKEGWFIMKEDVNEGTYRYIKGDSNFTENWDNREKLKYDYFNRVFPKS